MQICSVLAILAQSALLAGPARQDHPHLASIDSTSATGSASDAGEIVVVADRLRSTISGPISPEDSLDAAAVAALGANNLADILSQLSAQTGGSQGRAGDGPIVLVNGRRIGSFDEVRNLPPEAIQRVDILPEEAALRLGYPAHSKPVNVVLKPRYSAITGELEDRVTSRNLRNDFNTEANFVDIAGDNRITGNLQYQIGDAVTEASRDVARAVDSRAASAAGIVSNPAGDALQPMSQNLASVPASGRSLADFTSGAVADDTGALRTLVPLTHQFTADAVFTRALGGGKVLTASARYDRLNARDLLGPAIEDVTVPDGSGSPFTVPVRLRRSLGGTNGPVRETQTNSLHLGAQLAGYSLWQWSLAGNYDRVSLGRDRLGGVDTSALQAALTSHTLADPFAIPPSGLLASKPSSHSSSLDQTVASEAFASGPLTHLPAGNINLSLRASLSHETLNTLDSLGPRQLGRTHIGGQASLDIPLATDKSGVGEISLGLNGALDHYSDAGSTRGFGGTLVWKPMSKLSLLFAASRDSTVPSMAQLGAVLDVTPDAAFYDYTTGHSIASARIDGGDPLLTPDKRRVIKGDLSYKPIKGLSFTATYTSLTDRNVLLGFPGLTSAIEAAQPGRITRDAPGNIVSIDARPFNAALEQRQELRLAASFNRSFGKGSGPKLPGGGGFGGGHSYGAAGSTIQFSLTDTIRLQDKLTLARGAVPVDLISANNFGEGLRVARHRIEAQFSGTHHGFGLRANAVWSGGGDDGYAAPGALHFSNRLVTNFRLFYFPAQQESVAKAMPWLKGVRFLLAVDNLFDSYQRVSDRSGATPLAYQRGIVEPLGRAIRLSIRKTLD